MSLPENVYSLDGEWFEEFDVIQADVDDNFDPGEKVSGYIGTPDAPTHATMVDCLGASILGLIKDAAFDEYGDLAENYLAGMPQSFEKGLQKVVIDYLNQYYPEPSFFNVFDVKDFIFTNQTPIDTEKWIKL